MPQQHRAPTPTYQGRALVRPDEEVVDQGLTFDVTTLMGRRRALRALGLGATALGLAACGVGSTGTTASSASRATGSTATGSASTAADSEIPEETAGPYPGDGSNGPDVLEESGIVRSDIRSSLGGTGTADGVPMTLQLTVKDLANGGAGFAGVAVYVWHCDRAGGYSMYSDGLENENYLRGVQVADAAGTVTFTSIFPACYSGRWPHIHFEVYPDEAGITDESTVIATSQVALPQDVCAAVYATTGYEASIANLAQVSLQNDNVFSDDSGALQLATVTGDVTNGFTVALQIGVDTTTTPTGGGVPGGSDGAPSGAPPGGGGTRPPGGPGGTPPTGPMPGGATQGS